MYMYVRMRGARIAAAKDFHLVTEVQDYWILKMNKQNLSETWFKFISLIWGYSKWARKAHSLADSKISYKTFNRKTYFT